MSKFLGATISWGIAVVLAVVLPLRAFGLVVENFDADQHSRFSSGFPGAPVENSLDAFVLSDFDLSGVGWADDDPRKSLALISPLHFVGALHFDPEVGDEARFLNSDGVLVSRTISAINTINNGSGDPIDLFVGELSSAILDADKIATLKVPGFTAEGSFLGMSTFIYGQNGTVGTGSVDGFSNIAVAGTIDTTRGMLDVKSKTSAVTGEAHLSSGDSGGPTFGTIDGSLALLGIHSATGEDANNYISVDSFLPAYLSEIEAIVNADGQSLSTVPEPRLMAAAVGCALLVAALVRRGRFSCRGAFRSAPCQ